MFVNTPTGYQQINSIIQLNEQHCLALYSETDIPILVCSPDHLVYCDEFVPVKDVLHKTIKGQIQDYYISKIEELPPRTLYDISVDGGCYYANDVLVHNSTVSAIFLLHYILFNSNKTVAILANKLSSAKEILMRVKIAYQNLPKFIQQGITEWNKNSIELENGSRIIASASSATSIRSTSISILFIDECLTGDMEVTIKSNTEEQSIITLENLYNRLTQENTNGN